MRINSSSRHQIYILARDDSESADGNAKSFPVGEGHFDFGATAGKVSYLKNDWRNIKTPFLDDEEYVDPITGTQTKLPNEEGKSQRNWAKAMHGFEILASAEFVITDRLHGHIMCTIMGIPHVLLDSKLKKNIFFHDTWTKDCDCTRVAGSFEEATEFAKMYFEKQAKEGKRL